VYREDYPKAGTGSDRLKEITMLVVHAAMSGEQFLLWGETADGTIADGRRLLAALEQVPTAFSVKTGRLRELAAWLPTRRGRPVLSLNAHEPMGRGRVKLAAWPLEACCLAPGEAVEFLCAIGERRAIASGVIVGADLAYWSKALRFAGSLVARQRYLPGLAGGQGTWRAVWCPIVSGLDAAPHERLAALMPPAARALTEPGVPCPPETRSPAVLHRFLSMVVDVLVRSGLPAAGRRTSFDSLHDAWLDALHTPDGNVSGDPGELERLAVQIRQWRRPLDAIDGSPFRLCFRLEEPQETLPEDGGATWYVRYLLQPKDDPSLLVEASKLWRAGGREMAALKRFGPGVREYLLAALGQAAGICPWIAASLEQAEPGGYPLSTAAAYEFLKGQAMALEEAGFGVLLPSWWTRRGTRARLALQARITDRNSPTGGLSLADLVEIEWTAVLGDCAISLEELQALAALKVPLVRLRGQWVELDATAIAKVIDLCRNPGASTASVGDVVHMALDGRRMLGLELAGMEATGRVRDLLEQLEGKAAFEELAPPLGFTGTLRPYQIRGYSWLTFLRQWGLGACLADDMGLGKTVQTLALIQREWSTNGNRPVLLVCPTSVINNWQREASRFTPDLPVMVHHGPKRKRGESFRKAASRCAMVISSYSLLSRDLEALRKVDWSGVILDEAQNIKNPETQQARAARSIRADFRVALTGTPVENNVGELWSIMEFVNPGLLGTWAEFSRRFFVPIQAERDRVAAERLKHITGPFILRRLKTDRSIIADLPEKVETKVFCHLTREQASLYAAVLEELEAALQDAEGMGRRGLILATLQKLKQVCNHPANFLGDNSPLPGRSGKLVRLTEMLEEVLESGERALVFTQFAAMGQLLLRFLRDAFGREVLFLHGGVPRVERDRMVERFQDGKAPIFVLSLKAGGTGLNLTAASHVFHFDRWWNPAVEDQATDRAFRIGQTRQVQVHKFVCAGTLEERIDAMIERKKDIADRVIGTGEDWLTELSDRELRDILALHEDAVRED